MKCLAVVACGVFLLSACGASEPGPASPPPARVALSATFEGRQFQPRGIVGVRDGSNINIFIYERAAACGTPSASDLPGESYFNIFLKQWPLAANGTPVDAHAAFIGVNASKREGSGGSSSSLDGTLQFVSSTPAGGTIIFHTRSRKGDTTLEGELQFAMCN